jgi:CRISPR-associated protein Csm4
MKHWRAVLGMRSPLATPLTADRLFGHICWGLAWHDGPAAVSDFLARMGGANPPLVLGQPVPVHFAPMPVPLQDGSIVLDVTGKRQSLWNTYRRCGLMPRAALLRAAEDLSPATIREALDASGWPRPMLPARQVRVRSVASRLSGGPLDRSDYLAVECWPDSAGGQVELLIASDLDAGDIERLVGLGLASGVGRAASVGYGQVELTSVEPVDWPRVSGANALVTLGPCVPKPGDPAGGWWRVQTHWGKLGGSFATDGAAAQKRPVMGLKAGAVLMEARGSGVGGRVPSIEHRASNIGQEGSGVGCRGSGVGGRASDIEHRTSGSGDWVSGEGDRSGSTGGQAAGGTQDQETEGRGQGTGDNRRGDAETRRDGDTAGARGEGPLDRYSFIGRMVGGVHPQHPEVVHYGLAPVLAVKMAAGFA